MKRLLSCIIILMLTQQVAANDYYVVTGSYESKSGAAEELKKITAWFSSTSIVETNIKGATRYRVRIGPLPDRSTATSTRAEAAQYGFKEPWILVETSIVRPTPTSETIAAKTPALEVLESTTHPAATLDVAANPRLSRQNSVEISQFLYTAPALETEVAALLDTMTNRPVQTAELLAVKDQINQLYVANGYVNTGVIIPDQQIHNGELQLDFIGGEVTDIQINSALRQRYVQSRLEISKPFNLVQLQQSLKALEQDPMVTRIDARVAPASSPGEAILALDIETASKLRVEIHAANDRSPSIGSENGKLALIASNLTGWGETYRIGTSVTQGLDAYDAAIELPLTSGGTSLQLQYSISDSSVIEEPFNAIDVESETESLGLMLNLPVYKTLSRTLTLQLTLEARRNQTSLLGQPFSFSEGAVNGESRVAPARLAMVFTSQNAEDSLAARFSISRGTSKFDATQSSSQADGRFTSYLAQVQYSKLLTERVHLTARVLAQHASDPLLSVEKYALGGVNTVRGYRQNQVVRDNAYLASIEAHYRPDLPIWIDFIGFLDWGSGENHDDAATGGKRDLSSIGVGVVVKEWYGFSLELFFAHGFDKFNNSEHDLQDDGVHFRLGYQHAF